MRSRRKHGLLAVGWALAITLAGCGGGDSGLAGGGDAAPEEVEGEFDWRRYEGETLRLVMNQHPWQEAIEPLLSEFTEQTGIEVEPESLPEDQYRQRVQVELTSGSSELDLFMSNVQQEGARFAQSGWYTDLRPFIEDEALTNADYDYDDFSDGPIEGHVFSDILVGIPIQLETQMLFYRRDILEEAGLEVPTTFEELETVAQQIDDPDGTRAFTARGRGAAAVTQLSTYLYNYGGQWADEEGSAAFSTPEGAEAIEFYGRMIRDYGPPGAVNNSWPEALALFQQGQVAMYTDASTFVPQVIDPAESTVADQVGFAPMPEGPGGATQTYNGWAVSISSQSEKQNPAWYFVQWVTGPEIVQELQNGGIAGARESAEFGEDLPEDWVETYQSSLPDARPQLPQVVPVPEVRDAIGTAIVAAIEGQPVEPAVDSAAEQFDQIVGSSR